ncbi:MAG: phosphoribosylanthranilate isomerase [Deltaproteobacteria bacterium]|nr:phosphoribosylanthranilate isomerase [Deltaproteobacteria bacterium]
MKNPIVKVCGLRVEQNLRDVDALGVELLGLNFIRTSPRFGGDLSPTATKALQGKLVGVFQDQPLEEIRAAIEHFALSAVQLHGAESPDMCSTLREGVVVMKAIAVSDEQSLAACGAYASVVDLFVFDTARPDGTSGGTGSGFSWEVLSGYVLPVPFLLAGGIGPDSVAALRAFEHERCVGIDLNSRCEREPGIKDPKVIAKILEELR